MSVPAGWYNDPQDPALVRYWDGIQWTAHIQPIQPQPVPPQPPQPPHAQVSAQPQQQFQQTQNVERDRGGAVRKVGFSVRRRRPRRLWPMWSGCRGSWTNMDCTSSTRSRPAGTSCVRAVPL
ncbi:DUF2510 domain-containing protein [Arthrobacter globiformis]|uniref:DUF2510 domain-containing protein n=1 Tax=Arthrobacter globiformis TaxID=1665 RepID=UPI0027D7C3F2|nr:DUF2510 domain-containing protein [Arthrobacter globiformis]